MIQSTIENSYFPLLRENMMAKKSAPKEKSIPRDYYDLFKENPYTTEEVVKVCLWSLGIIMNFS